MNIWNLFKDMENIQHQLGTVSSLNNIPGFSFSTKVEKRCFPLINVSANDNDLMIEALAPGIKVDTLKVSAIKDELTISGEIVLANTEQGKFYKHERAADKFSRSIKLPFPIKTDGIIAEYKNGIINISLPKAEEVKPKQIEVKLS